VYRAMAKSVSLLRTPLLSRCVLNNTAKQAGRSIHRVPVVFSDQDSEQRMTLREIERDKRQKKSEYITSALLCCVLIALLIIHQCPWPPPGKGREKVRI